MPGKWKHGYIPLTPAAVRSKNHGRKPGPGSKLGKLKLDASTPAGRSAIRKQIREREDRIAAPAMAAAKKAGFTGPPKRGKPKPKTAKRAAPTADTAAGRREIMRRVRESENRAPVSVDLSPLRKKPHRKLSLKKRRK